jgi:hypothetical protein
MDNNSFLKKFQGRTEVIGKQGLLGVMNNVHINVNDYKYRQKPKKQINIRLQRQNSKDQYNYISSEISKEFNKNKNFIPQLKSASNRYTNNKENNKNISNNSQNKIKNKNENYNINSPKRNNKKNNENNFPMENRINRYTNKASEKPIKLFKSFDQKINNDPNKYKSQNNLQEKQSKRPIQELKKNVYDNANNNRRNFSSKNRELNIKLNLKLPKIASKYQENNDTNKKQKVNKSYEKKNTFTPKIKNSFLKKINFRNNYTEESEERPNSLKKAIEGKMGNNKKKNKHNTFQGVSLSNNIKLPKINLNRNNNFSGKNTKKFNPNPRNSDVLNNIKRDFMMLDSIKNHGKIQKNKSFKDKNDHKNSFNINNKNVNNQYKNRVSNNDLFNYNINNFNNNYNNMNYLYNSNNKINSRNNMNYYNEKKKISKSYDDDQFYNDFNENIVNTSSGRPQRLQDFNDRLDIISEEEEDRFITNSQNNYFNDGNNRQSQNILEILMNQRRNYQNRLPNNSRFKLNVEN